MRTTPRTWSLLLSFASLTLAQPLAAQDSMTATVQPALERAIAQSHIALDAILNGDPSLYLALFAETDNITLGNPFGPFGEGREAVAATLANAASKYQRGKARVERVSLYTDDDFATLVELEHDRAQLTGRDDFSEFSVRVTSLYRRFGSEWRLVHRHADPITAPRTAASLLSGTAIDRDAIADEIRADVAETVAAFNARDAERATRSNAPDFLQMFHGQPNADGATNLANTRLQVSDPALNLTISDERVDVADAGDMVIYTNRYAYTFTNPASGEPAVENGNWVLVYKRQPDGSFKIFREVISDLPPED